MADRVSISSLVRDTDFYPRHRVDGMHVRRLAEALDAGAQFPPVVADKATRILTDGWHRCQAVEGKYGPGAEIEVEWVEYETQAEVFLAAASEAAVSKLPLSPHDQARIVVRAEELGVPLERVASAITVPVEKLRLRVNIASPGPSTFIGGIAGSKPEKVVLKSDLAHLAGTELTDAQIEANRKSAGLGVAFHANQVSLRLRAAGSINLSDPRIAKALLNLHDALDEALPELAAAANE